MSSKDMDRGQIDRSGSNASEPSSSNIAKNQVQFKSHVKMIQCRVCKIDIKSKNYKMHLQRQHPNDNPKILSSLQEFLSGGSLAKCFAKNVHKKKRTIEDCPTSDYESTKKVKSLFCQTIFIT